MLKKIFTYSLVLFSLNAKASDNMTSFLKSCAYGTLAGAGIGLATLATSENPNGKMSNVARGASLGLYLGIAYGLYQINNPTPARTDFDASVWLAPQISQTKVDGASINWLALSF